MYPQIIMVDFSLQNPLDLRLILWIIGIESMITDASTQTNQ